MNKMKQYESICTSLIKILDVDDDTSIKIFKYITNYGVVNFFRNIELMDFSVETINKLQAVQDVLTYVENTTARYGGVK